MLLSYCPVNFAVHTSKWVRKRPVSRQHHLCLHKPSHKAVCTLAGRRRLLRAEQKNVSQM